MHLVAAQKSSWIREYAEPIWVQAIKEQFDLTAIEPNPNSLPEIEINDDVKDVIEQLKRLDEDISTTLEEKAVHDGLITEYRSWKAELRKLKGVNTSELEKKISTYETNTAVIKASLARLKSTKTAIKKRSSKEVSKELRRIESLKRNNYIKAKLDANKDQFLFKKCAVIVRVYNISNHEFDAPNFGLTLKPILDAGTDSGLLWEDDNNSIIEGGVLFLSGGKSPVKGEYMFEIEVISEWPW